MTAIKESLLNILKKIPISFTFLILAAVIVFVIIVIIVIRVHNSSKARKRRNKIRKMKCDFGDSCYRNEILSSLPKGEQLDFSNLYRRLDELENFVNQGKRQLELQEYKAIDSIDRKICESQNQIRDRWNYQKKKSDFYHCICVHYASFTLADSIKRQQENIRDVYVKYKMECDQLSKQIDFLSRQIANSNGQKKYECMQQHKANCKKASETFKIKKYICCKKYTVSAKGERTKCLHKAV